MSEDVGRLYERALALDPEDRPAFVRQACGDDRELEAELLSLLKRTEAAETFFGRLSSAIQSISPTALERVGSGELEIGQAVGRYRIRGRIGGGGMGAVYRAQDTRLGRDVALKFLSPGAIVDEEARERLLLEARTAAALDHPNVCTVHEIGETEDGRPFIAMALYDGESLKERLRDGPLPVAEAVDLALQIVHGLAVAHGQGIVHRDVKPGNVMVTAKGTVKLLDFGLAKIADVTLTRAGATPGTPAYMSPEQVRGDELDPRADLWGLGVVLYEMLTGVRPFRGGNDRVLVDAILHRDPPPISTLRPEAPESLTRIVERLLAKEPGDRYRDAAELLGDLKGASPTGPAPTGPPPARGSVFERHRRSIVAGAVGAVALVATALLLTGNGGDAPPAASPPAGGEPSIVVLPLANLSADPSDAVLADGMTEELISALARMGDLRVIASTSAFAFDDRETDVRSIADSLDVSHVLEGSLQKIGSRLRVQVRLLDPADGSTRWSETYDRELEDVFAIQDEIARAVARELDVRLAAGPGPRLARDRTPSLAAYEFYLRGNDPALLRSDEGARRGLEYLRQAIAADSTYAAAHAGLVRFYLRLLGSEVPGIPTGELHARAEAAARKAVALDDSLSDARAVLGLVHWFVHRDFTAAERELARAIELDPSRSLTRQWLAQLYMRTGRPEAALEEARRALERDPLSPSAHAEVAHALLLNGRYDEALAQLEPLADVQPPLLRTAAIAAQAYVKKGMWPEAIAAVRPRAEQGSPEELSLYGYVLARAGRRDEALEVQGTLLDMWRSGTGGALHVAQVYAGLGDLDLAFAWLERSIEAGEAQYISIFDPTFDALRNDPRFERLTERLGIQNR